jgi:energy-coupling factor transport system ATP-binding protein
VAKLHQNLGMAVILVSHSMEDIAQYVQRILVMNQGAILLDGTPHEVFCHYQELESIGLAAPQVTYLMHELAGRGIPVDTKATTLEEAKAAILQAFAKPHP